MRVQTFLGKVSMDSLRQMDEHINEWLEAHQAEPITIQQCFGYEQHGDGDKQEPVIITSVWY